MQRFPAHAPIRLDFYPRPPRGGRPWLHLPPTLDFLFLPTPSTRRATDCLALPAQGCPYFYPRPPRGGRPAGRFKSPGATAYFYPRPPRGGRPSSATRTPSRRDFYPRPPRGGRRAGQAQLAEEADFYPRPPRGGRQSPGNAPSAAAHFYPRPPRGGRRAVTRSRMALAYFYPRPPRGGRHWPPSRSPITLAFLPTPSTRRATRTSLWISAPAERFLPTPSTRRATLDFCAFWGVEIISTHALHEEGDPRARGLLCHDRHFYPRPPRGGRPARPLPGS